MDQDSAHMVATSKVPMLKPVQAQRCLNQTFDRLQKIASQLELLDESFHKEDSSLVHEDLQQIHPDDMEEMDLRWKMTMLTMRWSATTATRVDTLLGSAELQEIKTTRIKKAQEGSDQAEEGPNYALMAFSSSNSDSEIVDNCKKGLGYENYNAVPPPYIGNFMPPTPDLSFTSLDEFVNEPVVENCKVLDNEEEDVSQPKIEKKTVRPSIIEKEFVKPKQQEKTARKTVKQVEQHRQNTDSPRGNQRNWNNTMSQKLGSNFEMFNKACYVSGSFDHLQVDCNYHQKYFQNQRMVKLVWNNSQRVNHQNFAKKTHPYAKKNMVPRAVLMKSGLVSINTTRQNISKTTVLVNTARQVNAAHSKIIVNAARPMSYLSKTSHSTDQGVIDSGCSRHMTGNMSYLTNYEEIDGGYVLFPIMVVQNQTKLGEDEAVHKELGNSLLRATTTASSLEAEQDGGNITKTQSKATPNESSSLGTTSGGVPRCQETMGDTVAQTRFENVSKLSNDSLLARGNTLRSDEDRLKLNKLMELCTSLQTRVLDLEKTKTSQSNEIDSLKSRIKNLKKKRSSRTHKLKRLYKVGLSARVESFRDEESLGEDASKQGRSFNAIDEDDDVNLVGVQDDADNEMFDADALTGDEVFAEQEVAAKDMNLTVVEVTLAQALAALKSVKPKVKGNVIREPSVPVSVVSVSTKDSATTTTTATIPTPRKGIVITELEPEKLMKKKVQIMLDEEAVIKLQTEFDEEVRLAGEKAEKNKKPILP
ncbi:hypothetical protein Tco_0793104 [Tanacetum coccineum]